MSEDIRASSTVKGFKKKKLKTNPFSMAFKYILTYSHILI